MKWRKLDISHIIAYIIEVSNNIGESLMEVTKTSQNHWSFGKARYLTYSEAVALKIKHDIATAQLFPCEILEVL
tara:strand:+ start:192 stop:413 length:222 start_codon:yes stop_codon:yes gene_type:complete